VTYFTIRAFGPIGAAIASVITSYAVMLPCTLVVIRRILQESVRRLFPWGGLAKVAVASYVPVVVLGLRHLLPMPDFVSLAVTGVPYVACTVAMFSWFGFVSIPELYAQASAGLRRLTG